MTRLLIVNADDFGLTPGVCEAILSAADDGVVTSTSALVVAPAWERYASALAASSLGVGAHLCVVGEDPPLLSAAEVPSLVDRSGRFPASWKQFVMRAAAGRVDDDDLRRELSAQLDALVGSGVRITHVDSHQHLHLWPQMSRIVVELAVERGINAARLVQSAGPSPRSIGIRTLARKFARTSRRAGMATPEASAGFDHSGRMGLPALLSTIGALGESSARSAEILTHPGPADDPERARYEWDYRWAEEWVALTHPDTRRAVEDAGFELGDFGDLAP